MKRAFEIVIVGAGMTGLALAARLAAGPAAQRLAISVIDAGPRPEFDSNSDIGLRVSALSTGSIAELAAVGAWQGIVESRACPYREMRVWDAAASVEGPDTLHFDAAEHALPELGFIVENELVRHALLGALTNSQVELQFDTRIASVRQTETRFGVALEGERELAPDLLIGADGAGSFVRNASGIEVKNWSYAQKAFVTHLRPQKSHGNTAWQRFLPSGPVGLLPLADGRVSMVWSTTPEDAAQALEADDPSLQETLTTVTDRVLGELIPEGPRGAFPLRAQYAHNYVLPGLALIGDAAHSIHPLAGQGVNLGIADAVQLAGVVEAALANDEYPGDLPVLRRYERSRKGANQTMLHFVDGLNRLFRIDSAPITHLRGAGMRMFNKSGPLKRQAVETALGIR